MVCSLSLGDVVYCQQSGFVKRYYISISYIMAYNARTYTQKAYRKADRALSIFLYLAVVSSGGGLFQGNF